MRTAEAHNFLSRIRPSRKAGQNLDLSDAALVPTGTTLRHHPRLEGSTNFLLWTCYDLIIENATQFRPGKRPLPRKEDELDDGERVSSSVCERPNEISQNGYPSRTPKTDPISR